jgi:hypothetical protein
MQRSLRQLRNQIKFRTGAFEAWTAIVKFAAVDTVRPGGADQGFIAVPAPFQINAALLEHLFQRIERFAENHHPNTLRIDEIYDDQPYTAGPKNSLMRVNPASVFGAKKFAENIGRTWPAIDRHQGACSGMGLECAQIQS